MVQSNHSCLSFQQQWQTHTDALAATSCFYGKTMCYTQNKIQHGLIYYGNFVVFTHIVEIQSLIRPLGVVNDRKELSFHLLSLKRYVNWHRCKGTTIASLLIIAWTLRDSYYTTSTTIESHRNWRRNPDLLHFITNWEGRVSNSSQLCHVRLGIHIMFVRLFSVLSLDTPTTGVLPLH